MNLNKNKAKGSALTTFIGGIVILLVVLFLLVKLATSGYHSDVSDSTATATETRIMPVGSVTMGDGTPVGQRTGEQIFNKICIQCHAADSAVANSPKLGNSAEWAPRIAQGFNTLIQHAVNGFNAMPARGGASDLTDDEVARAIAFMANQSGADFTAPAVGSDTASAASDTAAETVAASPANEAGKAVFDKLCFACHAANSVIPFSPKLTNKADWAPRIKQGKETVFKHALEGYTGPDGGVMPAKGGGLTLSDDEVKAAVTYMVNESGGKF
ncbi:c-type cytochrome [Stenoxybacter acetivorans]|uniref:c-type cytochrome n=1 Tax=Stenoxybacter acetivorans TaxID=422441 RepID=UPI00056C7FEC|nr:c-type cytochrome [Stenoxybacter acetivorans]